MDFMMIKQASEKWDICTRRVQTCGKYIKTKSGNGENENGKKTV